MLNLPQRMGWGKEPKSQHQTLSEQKQQRVIAGVGRNANLPKELLAPSRGQEKHKVLWGVDTHRPTPSKQSTWWIPELITGMEQRATFKTELPFLTGGGANQTVSAEGQCSCCLVKTTALTTLHELAILLHNSN
jgi:hypothetical protein